RRQEGRESVSRHRLRCGCRCFAKPTPDPFALLQLDRRWPERFAEDCLRLPCQVARGANLLLPQDDLDRRDLLIGAVRLIPTSLEIICYAGLMRGTIAFHEVDHALAPRQA